jgi:hypothetical protein
MSIFQSFQTGLAMGQQQRKERDRDTARKSAADAFKAGNYEMAPTALMEVGDFEAADAYARAGDRATAEQRRKTYGETFKTGGWTGLGEMAAGQGDFETAGYAQGQARAMTLQDWQDHDRKITVQKQGVEFLATSAGQLRSLPLEARGQAAMDIIAQSPFADNPQVMQAVQQAAADGRITDDELTAFEEQMLTYAQKLEGQRWQKSFDQSASQFAVSSGLDERRVQIAEDEAEAATAEREAKAAASPEINVDDEASFRREYNSITSGFRDVQASYGRIKATDATTPAGQLSLVYQYMKMLDPGSTVMQGEQASAANAAGVPEKTRNLYNSIIEGKPLSGKQVADFTRQADLLYNRSLEDYDKARITYEGIANQYGFDPRRTVPDYATGRPTGEVFRGGAVNRIPQGAVQELMSDPSPEKMRFFDEYYGPGQAQKIIQQQGLAPSRITF